MSEKWTKKWANQAKTIHEFILVLIVTILKNEALNGSVAYIRELIRNSIHLSISRFMYMWDTGILKFWYLQEEVTFYDILKIYIC